MNYGGLAKEGGAVLSKRLRATRRISRLPVRAVLCYSLRRDGAKDSFVPRHPARGRPKGRSGRQTICNPQIHSFYGNLDNFPYANDWLRVCAYSAPLSWFSCKAVQSLRREPAERSSFCPKDFSSKPGGG